MFFELPITRTPDNSISLEGSSYRESTVYWTGRTFLIYSDMQFSSVLNLDYATTSYENKNVCLRRERGKLHVVKKLT